MSKIIFEDRYSATGTPYPDDNSCDRCDAMGLYPCKYEDINEEARKADDNHLVIIGQIEEDGKPMPNDGWLIIQCPVCHGSRKKVDLS